MYLCWWILHSVSPLIEVSVLCRPSFANDEDVQRFALSYALPAVDENLSFLLFTRLSLRFC